MGLGTKLGPSRKRFPEEGAQEHAPALKVEGGPKGADNL
jgi:hypothetical protein